MEKEELFYVKKFQKLDSLINEILMAINEKKSDIKYIKEFYNRVNYIYVPLKKLVDMAEKYKKY